LIEPPISLDVLRERLPSLRWAKYPRSITTLSNILARRLNGTISTRKSEGVGDVASLAPEKMSDHELRALAIACARRRLPVKIRSIKYRNRSTIIHRYVLRRAGGECEGCRHGAPFAKEDGSPYLEPHHTLRVADDGPDHPATVIALCPNCHRRVHYSSDRMEYNKVLRKKLKQIEPRTRS
jgi:hypothetical protein